MRYLIAGFFALVHAATFAVAADAPARETLSLDAGWRFNLGDIPMPEISGHGPGRSYDTEVHRV